METIQCMVLYKELQSKSNQAEGKWCKPGEGVRDEIIEDRGYPHLRELGPSPVQRKSVMDFKQEHWSRMNLDRLFCWLHRIEI